MDKIRKKQFDVIILDWILGDEDGLKIGQQIRKIDDVPILMLSINSETEDIVEALDSGIDDYLVKPFSAPELEVRVKNLIKRSRKLTFKGVKIKANNLVVDIKNHIVKINDQPVALTKTEYQLLVYLLLKNNRVIEKNELIKHTLSGSAKTNHLINTHILNLRKKVKNNLKIKTISNQGFMITK